MLRRLSFFVVDLVLDCEVEDFFEDASDMFSVSDWSLRAGEV